VILVFLELVEVLDTLQDDDDRGQAVGHPHRAFPTAATTGSAAATASSRSFSYL